MDVITIQGGRPLRGAVIAAGSKNAALPIMAACLMADGPVVLDDVPEVSDVNTLALLLGHLGVEVKRHADGRMHLHIVEPSRITADEDLVGRMRASFCVLGPLLARRRTGHRAAARRLPHRSTACRRASARSGRAGREHSHRKRLRVGRRKIAPWRED